MGGFVVNCCREQWRRRPDGQELRVVDEPSEHPEPDGRLDLDRLLVALPETQRTVMVLFAVEGYTHEEIAGLLGIAPGTSKSRLFEARRKLREIRDAHRNTGDRS